MDAEHVHEEEERLSERIQSAAVSYKGEIFLGSMHVFAREELLREHPDCAEEEILEGFVTTAGRFVGRKEAHDIAVASNQARAKDDGMLRSQDLH